MDQISNHILNLTSNAIQKINSGQKDIIKIKCRNSFERKFIHDFAEKNGISHRSIIDYTNFHKNMVEMCCQKNRYDKDKTCNISYIYMGYPRTCCSITKCVVYHTPYSFVELGNGYEKEIIGSIDSLPEDKIFFLSENIGYTYLSKYLKGKLF
uniref:R3h domain-containing protein n=1 Tax=Borely moumouvirus TaxID=2712067 RepID=A0A6G6ABS9_9VIRU